MRVCDITFTPGPLERFALGSLADSADAAIVAGVAWEVEVCPEAAKALREKDWTALAAMATLGQAPAAAPVKKERKKRTPKPAAGGQVAGVLAGDDALAKVVDGIRSDSPLASTSAAEEWERAANAPAPLSLLHGGDDAPQQFDDEECKS